MAGGFLEVSWKATWWLYIPFATDAGEPSSYTRCMIESRRVISFGKSLILFMNVVPPGSMAMIFLFGVFFLDTASIISNGPNQMLAFFAPGFLEVDGRFRFFLFIGITGNNPTNESSRGCVIEDCMIESTRPPPIPPPAMPPP